MSTRVSDESQGGPVRRRLAPLARREEIVAIAHEVIVADGAHSLSLRSLARRCGMSAPGLMHHFPDMKSLLEAVLAAREARDVAAIDVLAGPDPTMLDMLDAAVRHHSGEAAITMRFDALEAEALDPDHPAHDYYAGRDQRTLEKLRPLIERDYADPDHVIAIIGVLYDGVRSRWVMHPERSDLWADWVLVRDTVAPTLVLKAPAQ